MRKPNTAKAVPETQDLRQRAARARDAAGRFIKRPELTEPDPVHALIEEHRAAYAEWDRLSEVWSEMLTTQPGYAEAVAASKEPARREIAAYEALFSARPTTLAGIAALGAHLGTVIRSISSFEQQTDGERALATITTAVQRFDAPSASPHPDATLFTLGAEFMAAWVAEEADGDEPEYQACSRIAEKIVRTPAVTVAGYGIKALLLARLDSDASGPHAPVEPSGPVDSWWNVLRQVQQGAARLAEASDMGIPMSATASSKRGVLITDTPPAGPGAPGRPDLSRLSIHQLARLYPVVARAGEVMGSAENAPCFWTEDRLGRTSAGCIVNWEAQRLDRLASEIALEISRRQPEGDDEREERAETMLLHALACGALAEHPELIAEINATWGA